MINRRISILTPFIIGVVCSFSFLGCNPKKTDNPAPSDLNKNEKSISNKETNVEQETKVLVFEQQFGPNENQKASYTLTFKGNKIEISYKYSDFDSSIEHGELNNGKIVTEGCTDCYLLSEDRLCVPNPETGESDCYGFINSKSTHSIEDVINPEIEGYFKGQKLKPGEKIIKVTYNQDQITNTTWGEKYCTKAMKVPNGKKWILLYARDKYLFPNGTSIYELSFLSINGKIETFLTDFGGRKDGRNYVNSKNINIAKAKDENMKLYSGDVVFAISNRKVDEAVKYDGYGGEMCFLEINE